MSCVKYRRSGAPRRGSKELQRAERAAVSAAERAKKAAERAQAQSIAQGILAEYWDLKRRYKRSSAALRYFREAGDEQTASRFERLSAELDAAMCDALERQERIIAAVGDTRLREILRLRYCECRQWAEVRALLAADGKEIPERTLYRMHGRALEAAYRYIAREEFGWENV